MRDALVNFAGLVWEFVKNPIFVFVLALVTLGLVTGGEDDVG